jgi:hypothetical protein
MIEKECGPTPEWMVKNTKSFLKNGFLKNA